MKTRTESHSSLRILALLFTCFGIAAAAAGQTPALTLQNARLAAHFKATSGLQVVSIEDRSSHALLKPAEAFSILFRDGRVVSASQFTLDAPPTKSALTVNAAASRAAEHVAGNQICANLTSPDKTLGVHWCAMLHDGTNYLRQEVTLIAHQQPVDIAEVRLFDFASAKAHVVGSVPGSPIVDGNFFFGFESPLSVSEMKDGHATSLLSRILPLGAGQSITYSSVIGVAAPGQMRRDFLAYLEQERAHPYRTFLHYNTWYDTGNTSDEVRALDRIHSFGEELVRKRGVTMDSYLFDDGWDDTHSVWQFNSRFPDGFTKIHEEAAKYGFGIGVWLSPWGGYGNDKKNRIATGQAAGYETVQGGYALSGQKYYERFEETCLNMIKQFGVNQFKFDGTGNASQVFPGSVFDSDFSAAIHLISKLREQEPDIFINLTTGTKPSPFWLRTVDSIWRGGDDHNFTGVGTWRQKWITYRDGQTYHNIVVGAPLYPISSLMLHGVIYGDRAKNLTTDPGNDFTDEVHDYFGEGTQLQELYITPSLLSSANWDALAESAKWSRSNAAVLKDTHWIGGDPFKLAVYGFASWSPKKGIIVLRNPSDKAQVYSLDIGKALELPAHAAHSYTLHSPWLADKSAGSLHLQAGTAHLVRLAPFQVLTLEATPAK